MEFYNYNDNVDSLGLNEIFVIHKGKRAARWKIIKHPNFDAFALVRDHPYLFSNNFMDSDNKHIVSGAVTIAAAYKQAYDHT